MTYDEALETLQIEQDHEPGTGCYIVPYACPGGYAVLANVPNYEGLAFILEEFHVNIFEELRYIRLAPPIVRHSSEQSSIRHRLELELVELRAKSEANGPGSGHGALTSLINLKEGQLAALEKRCE